jgi:hypothetical protein
MCDVFKTGYWQLSSGTLGQLINRTASNRRRQLGHAPDWQGGAQASV